MCGQPASIKERLQYRLAFICKLEVSKQVQAQSPENLPPIREIVSTSRTYANLKSKWDGTMCLEE